MVGIAQGINQIDGKYRVLAQLGQGGTADVSLAVARGPSGFNKLVVLKSMKSSMRTEPELARMFLNEARLAARLNHPNIVQTNEVFEFDGLPTIVMEYLEGQALSTVLSRARETGKFPLAMHLRVISEALGGLQYSHELRDYDGTLLNVVHRDISPHNVFITFDGQVKLLDFGIAKLSNSQAETATGVIKGKLHYMAPEQIEGETIDRRADLYSVGVMLWEAATGQRMWQGLHDATVMNLVLNGEIPRASEVRSVPAELERIIDKALAHNPDDRYATAHELQIDLENYIATLQSPAKVRDIGKVVAELFDDVRTKTRQLIETQLAKVAPLSAAEYAGTAPLELTVTHSTALGYAGESSALTQRSSRGRPGLVAAALLAVLLLGVGAWRVQAQRTAAAATRAAQAAKPPSAPVVEKVHFQITAFPAHAKLYMDGELLPSNPFSRMFARDPGQKHQLVVEAPGHVAETRELVFDQDTDIVLTLHRAAPPPAAAPEAPPVAVNTPPAGKQRSASTQRSAKVQPAASDCDVPYFIDARGVKRFKPNCL